ncbi:hypothetical protein ACHAXA_006863 [Cyclostephanos tholiformis]|uniref:PA14 domain-containing protein n=1 Tax=Cyclostephanos tholiformis TaxID=382380 RepID=A0ABD3REZ1_9STRA
MLTGETFSKKYSSITNQPTAVNITMKLSVLLFSFATAWHSVYGQDQSTFLRGSDVDAAMAKESGPTSSLCATILTVEGLSLNRTGEDSYIVCQTLNGKQYRVTGVPNHVFEGNKKDIIDGIVELDTPKGVHLDESTATLNFPDKAELRLKLKNNSGTGANKGLFYRSRRSLAVTGTRSVLVVRVVASNLSPPKSEATLSDTVFGNGADGAVDSMTLKSLYNTCSHGQLNFAPASDRDGRSIRIRNGATTVNVATSGTDSDVVTNAAIAELNAQFSITNPMQLAQHIIFFLPFSMGGANADLFGAYSRFGSDEWVHEAGVLAHEIGHNLGMLHSKGPGGEYGDHTCIMGVAPGETGPQYCFNAVKSWNLGWYKTRHHVYNVADGMWNGRLIGQVDYMNGNDSTSKVVLKLNTTGSTVDWYVMFNRIKTGTADMGSNKVVIVKREDEFDSSFYVAELSTGESATLPYENDYLELKVNHVNLSVNPAYADITIKTTGACVTNCGAALDTWTDISGRAIADLMVRTNNLTDAPNKSERLGSQLESTSNVGENYGIRMKGWLLPPVTGNYEFWIASDDNGEFWLSADDNPANKIRICSCDWASSRQWDKYPEQKSTPLLLVAGKPYYFEALMKEEYSNDNLAIAWQYHGKTREVIPAEFSRTVNPLVLGATIDTWTGISGITIASLMAGTNNLANTPNKSERLGLVSKLDYAAELIDNFGVRIKGWLVPPISGSYQFWIASDDNGEFWLSSNDDPANKVRRCSCDWVSPGWWDRTPAQKSSPISLVAGQAYFYEALMKEGTGYANLAVAWEYPGVTREVIPAKYSRRMKPSPDIMLTTRKPTSMPTTPRPTTMTSSKPTTRKPGGSAKPTTRKPTSKPTQTPTNEPTTEAPTTEAPTTEAPTTESPTTDSPTTDSPTITPTTAKPTTRKPSTTSQPTTRKPSTRKPTTRKPTNKPVL